MQGEGAGQHNEIIGRNTQRRGRHINNQRMLHKIEYYSNLERVVKTLDLFPNALEHFYVLLRPWRILIVAVASHLSYRSYGGARSLPYDGHRLTEQFLLEPRCMRG